MWWCDPASPVAAPKFVDSLIRIRGIGSTAPVFRFDVDVLFNQNTLGDAPQSQRGRQALASCLDRGVELTRIHQRDYFIRYYEFSGKCALSALRQTQRVGPNRATLPERADLSRDLPRQHSGL